MSSPIPPPEPTDEWFDWYMPEEEPPTEDDSEAEEERIESVIISNGIWQTLPPPPMPKPRPLSPDEQREAAQRYIQTKYTDQATMYQIEPKMPTRRSDDKVIDQAAAYGTEIHQQIEKHYTDMVHRNPDGSDPLVEEPGP